jgi:hypothetical protein
VWVIGYLIARGDRFLHANRDVTLRIIVSDSEDERVTISSLRQPYISQRVQIGKIALKPPDFPSAPPIHCAARLRRAAPWIAELCS